MLRWKEQSDEKKNRDSGNTLADRIANTCADAVNTAYTLYAGFEALFAGFNRPVPFQKFLLEDTGAFFDQYILETAQKENLSYVGGTLLISLDSATLPASSSNSCPVYLSADFYFQTPNREWILKEKDGKVDSSRFSDWATDSLAAQLRTDGKLKLSIEPPETGE